MWPVFAWLFVSPWSALAVAIAVAALPIVIHLLSRKRYRIHPWAAMRFLLAAQRRQQRRRRIEQWLLLTVRILLLLLLVTAMASVTSWAEELWQRWFPAGLQTQRVLGRTHHILLIDVSFSLRAEEDGETRFERLRQQAESLVASAAAGDAFSVVLLGAPSQLLIPGPAEDRQKVLDEIRALRPSESTSDLSGGLQLVFDLTRAPLGKFARRHVGIFTDWQRSTWSQIALPTDPPILTGGASPSSGEGMPLLSASPMHKWKQIQNQAVVSVIDVARQELSNYAITDLRLSEPLALANAETPVAVVVRQFGGSGRKQILVRLRVLDAEAAWDGSKPDEPRGVVESRVVEVPDDGSVTLNFLLKPVHLPKPGDYLIQAELADRPDALAIDDVRRLAVSVRDSVPVLLVNGKLAPDPLQQSAYWLRKALQPLPLGERSALCPAEPTVVSVAQFADPLLADLSRFSVVFLCDVAVSQLRPAEIERLEMFLRRGGSLVIGFGPNSAKDLKAYNRWFDAPASRWLPVRLFEVRSAETNEHFTLFADEEQFQLAPLSEFRTDRERGSLALARFRRYVRLELTNGAKVRKILSFLPVQPNAPANPTQTLDPAMIEAPRYRGRVVLFASSFNADWTSWPASPSYLPFMQQLLRYLAQPMTLQNARTGEPLEEALSAVRVGLTARWTLPTGRSENREIIAQNESGLLRWTDTERTGLYLAQVAGEPTRLFTVNVPQLADQGSESDLRPLRRDSPSVAPLLESVRFAESVDRLPPWTHLGEATVDELTSVSLPRGPTIARWLLLAFAVLLLVEMLLAWQFGSARAATVLETDVSKTERGRRWLLGFAWLPIAGVVLLLLVVGHAWATGGFLGFLADPVRARVQQALDIPEAPPGEETRMELEFLPYLTGHLVRDRWAVILLAGASLMLTIAVYRWELSGRPDRSLWVLIALRSALLGLTLLFLLPQARLVMLRESWPDLAIVIDTSQSMSVVDRFSNRADADMAQHLGGGHRLRLTQQFLTSSEYDWFGELLRQRKMRLHLYATGSQLRKLAEANSPQQIPQLYQQIEALTPDDSSSRLGESVSQVLQTFRGGSLNGVILFSDGVTTHQSESLPVAGQKAGGMRVPLFLVGVGESKQKTDLALSDLQVEDVVNVNDRLILNFRLTAKGNNLPGEVTVSLFDQAKPNDILARETVKLAPQGEVVRVKMMFTPREVGDRTFVLEVPVLRDEEDTRNNRLERLIRVEQLKKIKVLYVETFPRYEFRYIKTLFERELELTPGNRSVELRTLLLSASKDSVSQDRTAIAEFPTREELFGYDVLIFGDVDPKRLPRAESNLQAIVDFVEKRGGGLLAIAGPNYFPSRYKESLLAEVLPIRFDVADDPDAEAAAQATILDSYQPQLTSVGLTHPLFRFEADDAANLKVWQRLEPMWWYATGYRRKATAEPLAEHPARFAERPSQQSENPERELHPLVLQQFSGAGRVLWIGFEETWRWRAFDGELRFNQFWIQAVRGLARSRVSRTELRLDRQSHYYLGDPIRVTVRFPDDMPAPDAAHPVRVQLERGPLPQEKKSPELSSTTTKVEASELQTLLLARKHGARATYETVLTHTPIGEYRFRLESDRKVEASTQVLPPPGEMDRTEMNRGDLQQAADESGGRFYTLGDMEKLLNDLPVGVRVALDQPCPPWPLWNHSLVLLLVVGLLLTEWLFRKRCQLL